MDQPCVQHVKVSMVIVASSVLKRACVIAKENDLQQCVGVYECTHVESWLLETALI